MNNCAASGDWSSISELAKKAVASDVTTELSTNSMLWEGMLPAPTLTNGDASTFNITSAQFVGGRAQDGGAIYSSRSNFTITGVRFIRNSVGGSGDNGAAAAGAAAPSALDGGPAPGSSRRVGRLSYVRA